MQEISSNTNSERSERTVFALKEAMRILVLEYGFAGAGTPAIVKQAGVTRGALYHHFSDKKELFKAIVEDDCRAVARQIDRQRKGKSGTLTALKRGADAFISAMAEEGRTRIILIEAPAVLGQAGVVAIEERHARGLLRSALSTAMESGALDNLPLVPLTELMSAMFDSASLNIENGARRKEVLTVVHRIIDGLAGNTGVS